MAHVWKYVKRVKSDSHYLWACVLCLAKPLVVNEPVCEAKPMDTNLDYVQQASELSNARHPGSLSQPVYHCAHICADSQRAFQRQCLDCQRRGP